MTARDRRAVMLGCLIIALVWLVFRGAPRLRSSVLETEERIAQQALLIERARDRLSRLGELDDSIRVIEQRAEALPRALLVGSDTETASVDLMRRARAIMADQIASLQEFRRTPSSPGSGELELARLDVVMETDLRDLTELLRDIESDEALGLESVNVQTLNPHADPEVAERLQVTVGVSGWFRAEAMDEDTLTAFVR